MALNVLASLLSVLPEQAADVEAKYPQGDPAVYAIIAGELAAHYDLLRAAAKASLPLITDADWRYEALRLAVCQLSIEQQSEVFALAREMEKKDQAPEGADDVRRGRGPVAP